MRDRQDDYLVAAALYGDADILVSGDADPLALRDHLLWPRIVTPAEFAAQLTHP